LKAWSKKKGQLEKKRCLKKLVISSLLERSFQIEPRGLGQKRKEETRGNFGKGNLQALRRVTVGRGASEKEGDGPDLMRGEDLINSREGGGIPTGRGTKKRGERELSISPPAKKAQKGHMEKKKKGGD